jgi:hypothetical protein
MRQEKLRSASLQAAFKNQLKNHKGYGDSSPRPDLTGRSDLPGPADSPFQLPHNVHQPDAKTFFPATAAPGEAQQEIL